MLRSNFTFRKACKQDIPQILTLIKDLAAFEKEPDAVQVTEAELATYGFGSHPYWWAFVAEQKANKAATSKIVGMALYYYRYSTWKGPLLYLEDLIIKEGFRGQGIGAQLMNHLKSEALEKGVKGLCWQVLDWNQPAIDFYKTLPNSQFSKEWINVSILFEEK